MTKASDIRVIETELYFLPVQTRVPLKFGTETTTSVTCARAKVTVADRAGRRAEGWGETPLSVQWVWPSKLPYEPRHRVLKDFTIQLAEAWRTFEGRGHPLEIGWDFQEQVLRGMLGARNRVLPEGTEPMPWLAALVCCSLFDIAVHDAYGQLHGRPVYQTYDSGFLNRDLSEFLSPAEGTKISFWNKYPNEFLVPEPAKQLRAWHLVGGLDLLDPAELTGT
ncbi:MAG: enolase superfamily enzyme related to L-alanine-DL-glutamate epimerase, partial [Verrucomicrobiales bacterium]|nr:enolase superfamily enzyme related to L-alanine-DL-glutamate epimerase [Verrucomicrobiales bacterium]